MPDRQAIQVLGLKAIGPYSQAVRAAGLLFVAGQPGVLPSSGEAAGSSFEVQARQAFKNQIRFFGLEAVASIWWQIPQCS